MLCSGESTVMLTISLCKHMGSSIPPSFFFFVCFAKLDIKHKCFYPAWPLGVALNLLFICPFYVAHFCEYVSFPVWYSAHDNRKSHWDEVRLNTAQPPLSHTAIPTDHGKILGRILTTSYFLYKVPYISYKKIALYALISAVPVQ